MDRISDQGTPDIQDWAENQLVIAATENCGFVTRRVTDALTILGGPYADIEVLVRCGEGRFLTPVRELRRRIAQIEKRGDYVRDVSLPSEVCQRVRARGGAPFDVREYLY